MRPAAALIASAVAAAAIAAPKPADAEPVAPHASWTKASFANGVVAAVFDTASGRLADLYTRPYRERAPGDVTPDLLWDAFFGIWMTGGATWLTSVPPVTASFENGTGILAVVREWKGIRLTERWFAPMGGARPAVAGTLTVRNLSPVPVAGIRLFSLHNLHVGPGAPEASHDDEQVTWVPASASFRETNAASGRVAYAVALDPPSRHAGGPANPWAEMPATGGVTGSDGGPARDDAVTAFQWDLDPLPGDAEVTVGVALVVAGSGTPDPGDAAAALASAGGGAALLAAERAWWASFHDADALPAGLAGDALALARQSLAFLAMSQVREPGTAADGQILASLPPGEWNRTWVRDQAYATVALAASGHADLAAKAVRFVAGAKTGGYQSYVGMPYLPSVCRYFGDGSEESDSNGDGPNVEFDGFGLYLWALHEAVAGGQSALLADAWPKARAGAADVIVSLVEPSGLVAADSGIWEHHWNGKQKHFANTSLTAALGLCAAANLADAAGDGAAVAEGFRAAARRVMAGVESELVAGGVLAGNIEEMASGDALDAAVVEAFGWGLMDPLGDVAGATLDALADGLRVASGHGLGRNDDGGWYDRQEWVFIDLRTATALRRAGRPVQSSDLAGWVLAQSRANLDQVAELYTEDAADYAGAVPMAGFGAASWLLWVLEHEPAADATACLRPPDPPEAPEETSGEPAPEPEPTPEPAPDVPEPGPDGPDPMPDVPSAPDAAPDAVADPAPPAQSGGGCSAGPSPVPLLAVLVAGLGCLTPRRRRGR